MAEMLQKYGETEKLKIFGRKDSFASRKCMCQMIEKKNSGITFIASSIFG